MLLRNKVPRFVNEGILRARILHGDGARFIPNDCGRVHEREKTYCGNEICGNISLHFCFFHEHKSSLKSQLETSAKTSKNLPVFRIFLIHLECCEVEPVNIERLLHKQKSAGFTHFFPYFSCPHS